MRPEVIAALRRLDVRQRAIVFFTYWQDRTPAEIADELGVTVRTVQRELADARRRPGATAMSDDDLIRDAVHELVGAAPAPKPLPTGGAPVGRLVPLAGGRGRGDPASSAGSSRSPGCDPATTP